MRKARVNPVNKGKASRKKCVRCKLHTDEVGNLSIAGLCNECGVVNSVAQMLGMTHMYYTTESVNGSILSVYAGPVSKVA